MDNTIAAHKQVEQTLRHLIALAEQAIEGIAILDPRGNVRFINSAWLTMHGYDSGAKLVGKQIGIFHTKEQMKTDVIPFIEETRRRGRLAGPVEHMRKNGTPFPTQTKMTMVKDESGKAVGLIIFATDTAPLKRTEHELKQCRHHLDSIKQQAAELKAANEKLQQEINQRRKAEAELKQYHQQFEQQTTELKARSEKLRQETNQHRKAEAQLKQYRQQSEHQTADLKARNEKLRQETNKPRAGKDELQRYCRQLEQHIEELTAELTTANEELLQKIARRKLSQVLLESSAQTENPNEETVLFNPQELKALSRLARRLA